MRNSTAPNDIIPTKLLKECADILAPPITQLINQSFKEGIVPSLLKEGTIQPIFKKPTLDPKDPTYRRPITGLSGHQSTCPRLRAHAQKNGAIGHIIAARALAALRRVGYGNARGSLGANQNSDRPI